VIIAALAATACTGLPSSAPILVPERTETPKYENDDVDSVAVWRDRVIATAKQGHRLIVFDAGSGAEVRALGREGSARGEFARPNGIAVAGDLLFVVERDNQRLQVLRMPGLETLSFVGMDVLKRPYGIAVYESEPGVVQAYVTDNFEDTTPLSMRVKHFEIRSDGSSRLVRTFGDLDGDGALTKVETIAVDPRYDRVLVVEEQTDRMGIRIYTLDGRFTGRVLGRELFRSEPEGISLYPCGGEGGFWIATDQHPRHSLFHLFDRQTLAHRGVFRGKVTANTDGIVVDASSIGPLARGGVWAVNDDRSVTSFDWTDLERALGIGCPPRP
jgi:3-phytase